MTLLVQKTDDGYHVSSETPCIEVAAPTLRAAIDGFMAAAAHVHKPLRIRLLKVDKASTNSHLN